MEVKFHGDSTVSRREWQTFRLPADVLFKNPRTSEGESRGGKRGTVDVEKWLNTCSTLEGGR